VYGVTSIFFSLTGEYYVERFFHVRLLAAVVGATMAKLGKLNLICRDVNAEEL